MTKLRSPGVPCWFVLKRLGMSFKFDIQNFCVALWCLLKAKLKVSVCAFWTFFPSLRSSSLSRITMVWSLLLCPDRIAKSFRTPEIWQLQFLHFVWEVQSRAYRLQFFFSIYFYIKLFQYLSDCASGLWEETEKYSILLNILSVKVTLSRKIIYIFHVLVFLLKILNLKHTLSKCSLYVTLEMCIN